MKQIREEQGTARPELSAQEARQARRGKPVLFVLIGLVLGAVVAMAVVGFMVG